MAGFILIKLLLPQKLTGVSHTVQYYRMYDYCFLNTHVITMLLSSEYIYTCWVLGCINISCQLHEMAVMDRYLFL